MNREEYIRECKEHAFALIAQGLNIRDGSSVGGVMIITLEELKKIVDEATKKYAPDMEVDMDSFYLDAMPENASIKASEEWPYNLELQ